MKTLPVTTPAAAVLALRDQLESALDGMQLMAHVNQEALGAARLLLLQGMDTLLEALGDE